MKDFMGCEMSLNFRKITCAHRHTHKLTPTSQSSLTGQSASRQRIHNLVLETIILGKHHGASPTAPFSAAQLGPAQPHWSRLRKMNSEKKSCWAAGKYVGGAMRTMSHPLPHRLRPLHSGRQQIHMASSFREVALYPGEARNGAISTTPKGKDIEVLTAPKYHPLQSEF